MARTLKTNKRRGILLSLVSLLLLAILPVISNSRPMEISALKFSLYLSVWQLIFSFPVVVSEYQFFDKGILDHSISVAEKKNTAIVLSITGVLFGISTFIYVLTFEKAGTISGSIAIQAYPLFAVLWEMFIYNRKKSKLELLFILLLMVGLYYLSTAGTWGVEDLSSWFLVALTVPFIWTVAHTMLKNILDKTPISPAQVTFFRSLLSSIIIFIIAISIYGPSEVVSLVGVWSFQVFAAAMGFVYYLELINWFYAVKFIDVSVASSITTPWPILTTIFAILFLQESIEVYHLISLVIVVISVYGIIWSSNEGTTHAEI